MIFNFRINGWILSLIKYKISLDSTPKYWDYLIVGVQFHWIHNIASSLPNFSKLSANWNVGEMANKEFEVLALDGHNFPTCATDIKVSLSRCGLYACLSDLETSTKSMIEKNKYEALYIIRNHIHPDLKSEYRMEENPRALWNDLKQRY